MKSKTLQNFWYDFWYDYGEVVFMLVCMLIIITLLTVVTAWFQMVGCESRWKDSGREHEWSLFAGCRVADRDGRLIPEKNMRDVQ